MAIVALAAYHNSFGVPFLFDDLPSISGNPTIRHLWPILTPLHPPGGGVTVEGRPILNLSFALNYATSRTAVWSYHLANLAILVAGALALFGIVRRTVEQAAGQADSLAVAFAVALIWELHPLQTESITYVAQRAESLMGLFYLLTLYAFVRGSSGRGKGTGPSALAWMALSWVACLLGMATKEVMVTAPAVVFLYDRTFIAGTFAEAWRRRKAYYMALAATWILLCALLVAEGNRGGTIGASAGVTHWQYLLCQCRGLVRYIRLSFWPTGLVFDYGSDFVQGLREVVPEGIVVLALLAATAVALRRKPVLGFLGAWFFLILAPTSSFVGGTRQMLAEHRMYLSLAAIVTLVVFGLYSLFGRRAIAACLLIALLLGVLTFRRNEIYRDDLSIWGDTVAKRPGNDRAQIALGYFLLQAQRFQEAIGHFEQALRTNPNSPDAENDLGIALRGVGRTDEAIGHFRNAIASKPGLVQARYNLGDALFRIPGAEDEAIAQYKLAFAVDPLNSIEHYNFGLFLARLPGHLPDAVVQFKEALREKPDFEIAHYNLAVALEATPGSTNQAVEHYEEAVRLNPDNLDAHVNLGALLTGLPGRQAEAIQQLRTAIAIKPDFWMARLDLAFALMRQPGHVPEAKEQCLEVLRLKPDCDAARQMLDRLSR